jgi:hypothetical protein
MGDIFTNTPIIEFNAESTNYPKFRINYEPKRHTYHYHNMILVLYVNDNENMDTAIDADEIFHYYELTNDIDYILRSLQLPFSFLLIDLDVHKPQYVAHLVIQQYDTHTYKQITNPVTGTVNILMEPFAKGDGCVGWLKPGKIYSYSLDAKVISVWQYDDKADISGVPPFYISYGDFANFVIDEKRNNLGASHAQYGRFLLEILKQNLTIIKPIVETVGETRDALIIYNHSVMSSIQLCQFTPTEYILHNTLVKFYLLIYAEHRFENRHAIVEFLEKTLVETDTNA